MGKRRKTNKTKEQLKAYDSLISSTNSITRKRPDMKRKTYAVPVFNGSKKRNKKVKGNRKRKTRSPERKEVLFNRYQSALEKDAAFLEYLKSPYWKLVKKEIHEIYNDRCELCRVYKLSHPKASRKNVHHLTYEHKGNEHRHLDSLMLTCEICHHQIHNSDEWKYKKYDPLRKTKYSVFSYTPKKIEYKKKVVKAPEPEKRELGGIFKGIDKALRNI